MIIGGDRESKCDFCGNDKKELFFCLNNKIHCRKCLAFRRVPKIDYQYKIITNDGYKLNYHLTDRQKEAAHFIIENVLNGSDVAINAVCGAGKTEIIYDFIEYCLKHKFRIGIAVPRKDVVIEIGNRLKKDFPLASIQQVYGGHSSNLQADIITFTTHQAYKYRDYFDYLVVDEVDAFPFKNNSLLQEMIKKSYKKNIIYLSATMPKDIEENEKIKKYYLNRRFHNFDLPVPTIKKTFLIRNNLNYFLKRHENKIVFVYFPTIDLLKKVSKKTKKGHLVAHSKIKDRNKILEQIRSMDKGVVFTTSILERGITVKGVQVAVYEADNKIFDKSMLIQISGRVGRSKQEPDGEILFLAKRVTKDMIECILSIKRYNNG